MIFDPFAAMETLVMGIGIILIVEGAFNLGGAIYTALAIRRFNKLHPETQSMLESVTGLDLNGDGGGGGRLHPRRRRSHRPGAGHGGRRCRKTPQE